MALHTGALVQQKQKSRCVRPGTENILQAEQIIAGAKDGSSKLPSVQVSTIQGGREPIEPLGEDWAVRVLHPWRCHVNAIQCDRIPIQLLPRLRFGMEREIVVHIGLVGQSLLVQLVALFRVVLKDYIPVPLERQGAANLAGNSDSGSLQ